MVPLRWLALSLLASGCTIIFDVDDLRDRPPPDAMPPADADLNALALTSVEGVVYEGAGAGASRPAVIAIRGSNIDEQVRLSIGPVLEIDAGVDTPDAGVGEAIEIVEHAVAADHTVVVAALRVPVSTDLVDGQTQRISITAAQAEVARTIELEITGLDELETQADNLALDTGTLRPLYSRVVVSHRIHLVGSRPALIRAVGDIEVSAAIDVDAAGRVAGPGGCSGGRGGETGGCGDGGGKLGGAALGAGGGGGGFGSRGQEGDSTLGLGTGGAAGEQTGSPWLATLGYDNDSDAGNRGNGGGGGGAALGGNGNVGGGGGGTLELTSGGQLILGGTAAARAKGANGGSGGGPGGGGSGGAILVRAYAGVSASPAWLSAPGGAEGGANAGNGGVGRIRVDVPMGDIGVMAETPEAVRGPVWAMDAPMTTRAATVSLTALGAPDASHGLQVNGERVASGISLDSSGRRSVDVALDVGVNEVCIVIKPDEPRLRDENKNCISIGYAPP